MPFELLYAMSDHLLDGDWNERHPGIRYEAEASPLMGALFLNSEGNPSLALGIHGELPLSENFNAFGEIGGATGYSGGDVVPFLRAGIEAGNLRLWVSPAATTNGEVGAVAGIDIIAVRF